MKWAGGLGTLEGLLHWLLFRPPIPPAPRLSAAPPVALVCTRATSLLWEHLLYAYAQYKYHECIDDMT
jgi:hypothetical protein